MKNNKTCFIFFASIIILMTSCSDDVNNTDKIINDDDSIIKTLGDTGLTTKNKKDELSYEECLEAQGKFKDTPTARMYCSNGKIYK